jgi:TRAP-type C4-dicarboxylate transport system substrate-binding protein
MRRRDFIKLSAGLGSAVAGLAPLSPARAQAKSVFKASDVQPAGYPTVAATENLGKKLEAATNGRLSVQMYPSMQLGGEKETIEQTQIGAIQLLRVSAGTVGPIVDDINVVNMPFLFKNMAHAEKMMDGPIGQELLDKITANANAGLVALCWMNAGARSLYNTKRPHQIDRRHKGSEIPRHRQSDLYRHDERAGGQRRRDGLRSGLQRIADRRHRRRRK